MVIFALLIIVSLLAVSYAAFTTGVLCAGNRQLRLVVVRVMALLGLIALGGACVNMLHAAAPETDTESADEASLEEAAEILVDAFGHVDENFIDRYTDLNELMAVEAAAEENVETVAELPLDEGVTAAHAEGVLYECGNQQEFHDADFVSFMPEVPTVPEWVGKPADVGGSGNHWVAVESGPWLTDVEAETALHDVVFEAVANYVDDQVGRRGAANKIRLSASDIEAFDIVQDRFADEYQSSLGPMQRKHAKLVFTPGFRSEIAQRWQEHLVAHRLVKTGVGVAVVMGMLFVLMGVFKRLGSSVR